MLDLGYSRNESSIWTVRYDWIPKWNSFGTCYNVIRVTILWFRVLFMRNTVPPGRIGKKVQFSRFNNPRGSERYFEYLQRKIHWIWKNVASSVWIWNPNPIWWLFILQLNYFDLSWETENYILIILWGYY